MDEGIELNFAAPADSAAGLVRRRTAQKGGRWTDRAKARKVARRTVEHFNADVQHAAPAASQPVSSVAFTVLAPVISPTSVQTRPTYTLPVLEQARKQDATNPPVAGPSRLTSSAPTPSAPKSKPPPSNAPQVISSLFTSNPKTSAPLPKSAVHIPGAPSNAPLSDTSTFEGLGLDPLLIRHLKGKMKVDRPTGIQRSALPYLLSSPLDVDRRPDDSPEEPLRDAFIQSQTGSGKTLAYLLPIIQTLLPLSRLSYIDRSIGTLAIIMAPTRELAQQISHVLEQVLSLSLSTDNDQQYTRWLVSGLLTGGSTRTHEKARLRKGVPILVSTPGRLLDHLQNTASFQCAKTMFLVLDEADRVMDLGFEETIRGIIKALDGRRRMEIASEQETEGAMRWPFWGRGRRTVLCSATVDAKVERLSGAALHDPITFRGTDLAEVKTEKKPEVQAALEEANAVILPQMSEDKFTPPSQLSQKYVIAPTKLRLVALVALLRSLTANKEGTKVIVFLSSTDSVDYHWSLLSGVMMSRAQPDKVLISEEVDEKVGQPKGDSSPEAKPVKKPKVASEGVTLTSALFPATTLHRLHGSLPLRTRMSSLSAFSAPSAKPSILFATSVASRGLDLPLVRAVVQYDLPTEGGANEYVHRVGRTARAGQGGEAWAFVGPSEADWVGWVEGKMGAAEKGGVKLGQVGVEEVLKKGFGGKGYEYEGRATEVQLGFERWVLSEDVNTALARKAFSSYIRAYSTHPLEEKKFFHPKSIHLGHLAKSFALREAPASLAFSTKPIKVNTDINAGQKRRRTDEDEDGVGGKKVGKEGLARNETERRMYDAVRKAGRAHKSGGEMGSFEVGVKKRTGGKGMSGAGEAGGGGGEFQVMGSGELERMVGGKVGR